MKTCICLISMWKIRYLIYLHNIFCCIFYGSGSQLDFIARIWNCEDVDMANTCKWNLIILITLALAKYWSWSPSTILWTYLEDGMQMNQMILALENKLEYKGKGNVYLQGNNHGHTFRLRAPKKYWCASSRTDKQTEGVWTLDVHSENTISTSSHH